MPSGAATIAVGKRIWGASAASSIDQPGATSGSELADCAALSAVVTKTAAAAANTKQNFMCQSLCLIEPLSRRHGPLTHVRRRRPYAGAISRRGTLGGLANHARTGENCSEEWAGPQREVLVWSRLAGLDGAARGVRNLSSGVFRVTSSSLSGDTAAGPSRASSPADAYHNPSYPKRTHLHDRARLEEALRTADDRVNSAFQKLSALANDPRKADFVRLFHQMQGARDQIADAVRRMPLETGSLYHEDDERFQQAVEALDRTWQRWQVAGR